MYNNFAKYQILLKAGFYTQIGTYSDVVVLTKMVTNSVTSNGNTKCAHLLPFNLFILHAKFLILFNYINRINLIS